MAIIIEEENNHKGNYTSWLGWLVILFAVAATAYYFIFSVPPPVTAQAPASFQSIAAITQIHFDPSGIINSRAFQSLKQSVPEPTSSGPTPLGKPNPFTQ